MGGIGVPVKHVAHFCGVLPGKAYLAKISTFATPGPYTGNTLYLHNPDRWGWGRASQGRLDGEDAAEGRLNYACNTLATVSARMLCVPQYEALQAARKRQTTEAFQHA